MNGISTYKKVSHIETDKNKLVLILFEELLKSLYIIKKALKDETDAAEGEMSDAETRAKAIEMKVNKINHCLDIFEELKNSIVVVEENKESVEMGYYLEGLYNQQIINLYEVSKGVTGKLEETINVLKGLIDVWKTIAK